MDIRLLRVTFACLLAAGCTVGPDYTAPEASGPSSWFAFAAPRPAPQAKVTKVDTSSVAVTAPIDAAWWTVFGDPELDALVHRAAMANLDIRTAALRLDESRQQRAIAGADQFPNLSGNGSYTREKASAKGLFGALGGGGPTSSTNAASTANGGAGSTAGGIPGKSLLDPFDLYSYGFDASWEIDLWGRVRREIESANATVQASEQARRAAVISVMAEVARDYVQLRGIQRTASITRQNLDAAQSALRLTQSRAAGGLTTELDVANARAQAANVAAQLPQLEQQEDAMINQISLLLAERPGALRAELIDMKPVPPVPPTVPVGLPSELLRRRPDIAQAEAQLHVATADIGVAVADFYPRITLSGSLSLQALQPQNLGTWAARQYAFGPSISLPIFEGGRLRGTLELRRAQQQEAALNYQKTVLQAWHEVANALDAYDTEQRRRAQLEVSTAAARQAESLARQRYTQGIADFLQVLDAQRTLLGAEQALADSTTTISGNLVSIYKALGGGWDATDEVAAR